MACSTGSPPPKNRTAPALIDVTRQARIVGAFGATGSGKSTFIKRLLPARPQGVPLMAFDPKREYAYVCKAYTDEPAFYAALNDGATACALWPVLGDPELRVRQFNRFCMAALSVARAKGGVCIVADELHLVTEPGNAPRGWRELIETGRALGVSIMAASIRPAAIDKSFWTNCTYVRACRLNYGADQKTLADCLNVPAADIAALSGLQYIERDLLTGETNRGELKF